MRDIPYELWGESGSSLMASKIGKPIQMDSLTFDRDKMGFAKIYVEVDLAKQLPKLLLMKLRNGMEGRI